MYTLEIEELVFKRNSQKRQGYIQMNIIIVLAPLGIESDHIIFGCSEASNINEYIRKSCKNRKPNKKHHQIK